jgi:hypothetical protein
MSGFALFLRLVSGFLMAIAAIFSVVCFSSTLDYLGKPEADHVLGTLNLAAFACFLLAFLAGGVIWVLTDISQQLAPKPEASKPKPIDGAFRIGSQEGN